jgi:hypothetical protein
MKIVFAISLAAIAGSVLADTRASVARAFGNTLVSTYPDGRTGEIWLKADGTYTGLGRKKTDPSSGHWKIKGDSICLSQSKPFVFGYTVCIKVPESGLESGFQNKAVTGEMTTVTLVHGHVTP